MQVFRKRIWQDRIHAFRYYKAFKFALIDIAFGLLALFINPYRLCRKFLQKQNADEIYAYGETPIATYEKLVQECKVSSHDTWIELGAGRGKGCFWMAYFTKCRVIGVEWIPQFVFFARLFRTIFKLDKLEFLKQDIETFVIPDGAIVYLYGIWPKLEFPQNAKIITISEPLEGYRAIHSFWVRFPWGRTRAFLQTVNKLRE